MPSLRVNAAPTRRRCPAIAAGLAAGAGPGGATGRWRGASVAQRASPRSRWGARLGCYSHAMQQPLQHCIICACKRMHACLHTHPNTAHLRRGTCRRGNGQVPAQARQDAGAYCRCPDAVCSRNLWGHVSIACRHCTRIQALKAWWPCWLLVVGCDGSCSGARACAHLCTSPLCSALACFCPNTPGAAGGRD